MKENSAAGFDLVYLHGTSVSLSPDLEKLNVLSVVSRQFFGVSLALFDDHADSKTNDVH